MYIHVCVQSKDVAGSRDRSCRVRLEQRIPKLIQLIPPQSVWGWAEGNIEIKKDKYEKNAYMYIYEKCKTGVTNSKINSKLKIEYTFLFLPVWGLHSSLCSLCISLYVRIVFLSMCDLYFSFSDRISSFGNYLGSSSSVASLSLSCPPNQIDWRGNLLQSA